MCVVGHKCNLPGINRDGSSRAREGQPEESRSKKTHLETTATALDAVLLGLPGVNHHTHEYVWNALLLLVDTATTNGTWHLQVMRRGETEADLHLVAKFIAASAVLQQDPAKLANDIIVSRTLEPILKQVG